jgi:hypothetical protein
MKKYIIGLGCSWTQGEGGYPEQVWKDHGGRVQVRGRDDYYLRAIEHENSWVNVLCRDHFPEYESVNLGARGIGNRGAVHQLHFCDKVDWDNSEGIIVLMMSGFERFDFFKSNTLTYDPVKQDDFYSNGDFNHYKWMPMNPLPKNGGEYEPLWEIYARMLWSEQFVAAENMMALLDLQTFAKAHGFKVITANAFNQRTEGVIQYFKNNTRSLADKFDWTTYVHTSTPYTAFMQKLVELDGILKSEDWGNYYQCYSQRDWPATYLTNCQGAHPTLEGYKIIAKELAEFIKTKYNM